MTGTDRWRWLHVAACAEHLDLPWIADAAALSGVDAEAVRAVCVACPALESCRAAASAWRGIAGCWAGRQREPGFWVQVRPAAPGPVLFRVVQGVVVFGDAA